MKINMFVMWFIGVVFVIVGIVVYVDCFDDIKKVGVLCVVMFDSNLLFGYVDVKSNYIVGFDVDYVKVFVDKFGVKL